MSFFIKSILIFSILFQTPVYAGDGSESNKTPVDMKSLVNQFHNEIEHSEEGEVHSSKLAGILSQWLENFNLLRVSMDTHRWTQMKYYQDSGKSEYIRNFPVLASFYFLSHTMEVFSGPAGVYAAAHMGLPGSVQAVIGTVGAIISIPGLDPLCMLLFVVSPLRPMQKMFTGIRIVAVKVSGVANDKLHLKEAAQKIFENKDRLDEILKTSPNSEMSLVYDAEKNVMLKQMMVRDTETQKPYLKMTFQTQGDKTWVESLEVLDGETLKQNKKNVDQIFSRMNLSARYALKKAIQRPRKTFYSEIDTADVNGTNIQFKEYAVLLKPKVRLKSQVQNEIVTCRGLFQ